MYIPCVDDYFSVHFLIVSEMASPVTFKKKLDLRCVSCDIVITMQTTEMSDVDFDIDLGDVVLQRAITYVKQFWHYERLSRH